MESISDIHLPPNYCQYTSEHCNQEFSEESKNEAFFIYPSQPSILANTIYDTVNKLNQYGSKMRWLSWEDLDVEGHIVFCRICQAIRFSKLVVADITTANFNVYFELGFAIGLKKPILPVRDTSYTEYKMTVEEVGIFDNIGYLKFNSSRDLISSITSKRSFLPITNYKPEVKQNQPIYYLKSHIDTDGSIKLTSALKKSYFRFRSFDPRETSRLSFHEAYKNVMNSVSIVAHLMSPDRIDSQINNARAAFICGLALSAGKHVLMIQEGDHIKPIDYRDIIRSYTKASDIPAILADTIKKTAESVQSINEQQVPLPQGLLERIDLGDVAAENEIQSLNTYFVKTPQFQQARQGHARLVVGRKGSGKTALFYGIRSQFLPQKNLLTIDLKPEGHQFTKFREKVLKELSYGTKLHTITAFWHYLLLLEIAKKLKAKIGNRAYESNITLNRYRKLTSIYDSLSEGDGDFSERLMRLTNKIIENYESVSENRNKNFTGAIYNKAIHELQEAISENVIYFDEVWILFDNLDKGFPTHGLESEDVLIIKCVLEATRKIQRAFEKSDTECSAIVFVRRDVLDLLIEETSDRGKEPMVSLDWSDEELIKELLIRRIKFQAPELEGGFDEIWSRLFELHVSHENSFQYIINRTFLRPRDILNFIRKCLQISISRDHSRVETDDILKAEKDFSEDMLSELRFEMRDVYPKLKDPILSFYSSKKLLSFDDIAIILLDIGIEENQVSDIIDILLWFSFLGIKRNDEENYAYKFLYNTVKQKALLRGISRAQDVYCIHPAFRESLNIQI